LFPEVDGLLLEGVAERYQELVCVLHVNALKL
jgi:hypothetical protein